MFLCIVCLNSREQVGASHKLKAGDSTREVPICSTCAPKGWEADRRSFYRVLNGVRRNSDEYLRRTAQNN